MMPVARFTIWIVFVAVLAACQTTGDPIKSKWAGGPNNQLDAARWDQELLDLLHDNPPQNGKLSKPLDRDFRYLERQLESFGWSDPRSLNRLGVVKYYLAKYGEAHELHSRALVLYQRASDTEASDIEETKKLLTAVQGKLNKNQ